MNTFMTIPKFKFWCQKILPLVYDDSLSYMELLCKVIDYLNKVIEDVNNIPSYIESILSEEGLTEILSDLLNELREQIARANENENTTASFDRDVDELVWLDGKLIRMTRAILAGDRYVEDDGTPDVTGNFVYTSVENEIQRVKDSLNNEISAREQADTQLQNNIDTEVSAREQADIQLQSNIDTEATVREDADTQLQSNIDTEATAREDADTQLQNNIDVVNNSRIYVNVLYPLNNLDGLDNSGNTDNTLRLQNIVNYYGDNVTYFFPCGTYLIEGTISVTFRHVSFIGEQRAGSVLKHSSNVNMFEITNVNFIYFEHLFFRNTNTSPTSSTYFLVFTNAPYCVVNDVSMYNSCRYIKFDTSQGCKCYDVQLNNDEIFPSATVIGILLTGRCVSSRFIRVTMNFINNTTAYGIYCIDWAQDIYIQRFETTGCVNAIYFYNTTAINPGDLIIRDCIFDLIKGPAIRLHDITTSIYHNTNILDTLYITPYNDSINCIRLDNVDNIIITNVGVNNPENHSNVTGLSINGGNNINVSNSIFADIYRGVAVISETENVKVNNCNYDAYEISNGIGIVFDTVKRGSIVNNNIVGALTNAISVNSTCENVIISLNNISSGSITDNGINSLNVNNITP